MRAGRRAHQADAVGIDPQRRRLAADELHRGDDVMHRLRIGLLALGREAIADAEKGNAARGEIMPPIVQRLPRADPPAAAVHADERRMRPRSCRQKQIAGQFDAVVIAIDDAGARLDHVRHSRTPAYFFFSSLIFSAFMISAVP